LIKSGLAASRITQDHARRRRLRPPRSRSAGLAVRGGAFAHGGGSLDHDTDNSKNRKPVNTNNNGNSNDGNKAETREPAYQTGVG
jgi:hypothetical protein